MATSKEDALAEVLVSGIEIATAPLLTRIRALEVTVKEQAARVQELEARPVLKDGGVWKSGAVYEAGMIVSRSGSGWICNVTHLAGSEMNHDYFRLFVQRGRDGKDKDVR